MATKTKRNESLIKVLSFMTPDEVLTLIERNRRKRRNSKTDKNLEQEILASVRGDVLVRLYEKDSKIVTLEMLRDNIVALAYVEPKLFAKIVNKYPETLTLCIDYMGSKRIASVLDYPEDLQEAIDIFLSKPANIKKYADQIKAATKTSAANYLSTFVSGYMTACNAPLLAKRFVENGLDSLLRKARLSKFITEYKAQYQPSDLEAFEILGIKVK